MESKPPSPAPSPSTDALLTLVTSLALIRLQPFVDRSGTEEERYAKLLELRPREEDFERVFRPSLVADARVLYTAMWSSPPPLVPRPGQNRLWLRVACTEDFVAW